METVSFYDADGRIVGVMSAPHDCIVATGQHNQQQWAEGVSDPELHYVTQGVVTLRPENPALLDGRSLSRLPVPSVISIRGVDYPCDESVAELAFDQPGVYHVIVRAWPYLNKEFTVENPAL
ncbi:hypothetical protein LMG3458_01092 [Achromobacter deleyi]|uniref:Uncharacterized protein n=1 Tax=Achromobacter deleyi TaxID=1353891 RepID=A0A6S6ZC28_9BURK|nr:hypothetical protein [Achromobacter deleyi]CAB3670984.1 hypothetical protein LMG3458_01092 [Achromobacter deleyi]CAB3841113.1 hypothetical protein LMG3481_01263 [Achromobacter deleyi]CAB3846461.1 hypothetical protein LMG3482_01544 [Achromobacter deleyi]